MISELNFFVFGLLIGLGIHAYRLWIILKKLKKAEEKMQESLCDKCKNLDILLD